MISADHLAESGRALVFSFLENATERNYGLNQLFRQARQHWSFRPWYAAAMANAEQVAPATGRARLQKSTTVFLVGNIELTMEWYKQLGFASEYYPPGFAILRRDQIEIFLQQQPGYTAPDDPGRRKRAAWNVYIITNDVRALYEEYSSLTGVKISRPLCAQEYGMMEFDVMDLNGHRLVFAQPIQNM